jgi:FlaA1/EpsC-like NDP-sugar epimerase
MIDIFKGSVKNDIIKCDREKKQSLELKDYTERISAFTRRTKQAIAIITDVILIFFTVLMSFALRYESVSIRKEALLAGVLAVILALPIFIRMGLYRYVFRYSGFAALNVITRACFKYGVYYFVIIVLLREYGIPLSIGILQPLLLLVAISISRATTRFWLNPGSAPLKRNDNKEQLLIYGAGSAGVQIASALEHNKKYSVVGFLDDNKDLQGQCINGNVVYSPSTAKNIVSKKNISSILIALPAVNKSRKKEIYVFLETLGVQIRTLPGIDAIADGKISISDIREFDIEDLLGRDPVPPNSELFSKCIEGKIVLVTGGAGSIGSELCRQIIFQKPECLIILDHSEYSLYNLHQELDERLKKHNNKTKIVPLLGDITNYEYVMGMCSRYRPNTIYHAAAYKHVPMVEQNITQGIRNNVFGTLTVAEVAKKCGVKHFILISTDKAVRPTNIMGASKRVAELILQGMAVENSENDTCFSMVRFGNVLGSSGSVVPLFRKQISSGGPVTLTDKEVTRYFMTIPEAAQLVIQAGAMADGGDVFLLDMGEPVRIIDMAKRMVELSGLTVKNENNPYGDIEIKIIGLRPGEKLYEELLINDNPISTAHPRIFKAHEDYIAIDKLRKHINDLEKLISIGDENKIKVLLKSIVKGYITSDEEINEVSLRN